MLNAACSFSTHLHPHTPLQLLLPTILPLALPLGIDLARERILKGQSNFVHDKDQRRQHDARRLTKPQRRAQEAHRAAVVHRRVRDAEREPRHHVVHQDAEVVAQVRARDAQRPHARQHEHVAGPDERHGQRLRHGRLQQRVRGLTAQRALVHGVADDAEREDGHGQRVAAVQAVAARELGDGLVVVFLPRRGVPEGRVEDDGAGRDWTKLVVSGIT